LGRSKNPAPLEKGHLLGYDLLRDLVGLLPGFSTIISILRDSGAMILSLFFL